MRAIYLLFVLALLASACRSGGAQVADRTPERLDFKPACQPDSSQMADKAPERLNGLECDYISYIRDKKTNKLYLLFVTRLENGDPEAVFVPFEEFQSVEVGQFPPGEVGDAVRISGRGVILRPGTTMREATISTSKKMYGKWTKFLREIKKNRTSPKNKTLPPARERVGEEPFE